jgi:hypothetical protein
MNELSASHAMPARAAVLDHRAHAAAIAGMAASSRLAKWRIDRTGDKSS